MSAYRIPGPDGRIVLVPADDGMTPYRHGTYVGGSLVQERKATPLPVPATNAATRERNAAYKAARKAAVATCGARLTERKAKGDACARMLGHKGYHKSRAALDRIALSQRTTR